MKKPTKKQAQKSAKATAAPPPEPVFFEHVTVERPYDRIANRLLAATSELNKALEEAHECAEMRVFIGAIKSEGHSMRYEPQIYNLTHSTLTYKISFPDSETEKRWQLVKNAIFKDAAGEGLRALSKKQAAAAPQPG